MMLVQGPAAHRLSRRNSCRGMGLSAEDFRNRAFARSYHFFPWARGDAHAAAAGGATATVCWASC